MLITRQIYSWVAIVLVAVFFYNPIGSLEVRDLDKFGEEKKEERQTEAEDEKEELEEKFGTFSWLGGSLNESRLEINQPFCYISQPLVGFEKYRAQKNPLYILYCQLELDY